MIAYLFEVQTQKIIQEFVIAHPCWGILAGISCNVNHDTCFWLSYHLCTMVLPSLPA